MWLAALEADRKILDWICVFVTYISSIETRQKGVEETQIQAEHVNLKTGDVDVVSQSARGKSAQEATRKAVLKAMRMRPNWVVNR